MRGAQKQLPVDRVRLRKKSFDSDEGEWSDRTSLWVRRMTEWNVKELDLCMDNLKKGITKGQR